MPKSSFFDYHALDLALPCDFLTIRKREQQLTYSVRRLKQCLVSAQEGTQLTVCFVQPGKLLGCKGACIAGIRRQSGAACQSTDKAATLPV